MLLRSRWLQLPGERALESIMNRIPRSFSDTCSSRDSLIDLPRREIVGWMYVDR